MLRPYQLAAMSAFAAQASMPVRARIRVRGKVRDGVVIRTDTKRMHDGRYAEVCTLLLEDTGRQELWLKQNATEVAGVLEWYC